MKRGSILALTFVLLCSAAAAETAGIYVILDGSGSMWGQLPDGTHKITAAKEVVKGFLPDDYDGRELAFRVYGHRREGDCSDTELVVPFSSPATAIDRMAEFADGVNPKGKTPISRSLRAALDDFGDRPGEIILISDGIETCDEDPCALVRQWRESNVAIRVHVVGLGLQDKERQAMACISEAAGTEYRDAQSADELAEGLKEIQEAEEIAAGEPGVPPRSEWQVLTIIATNAEGERVRVRGTAKLIDGTALEISNNGHQSVPPGEVELALGIETESGNIYQPVTETVTVGSDGSTRYEVVVPEPPTVTARFVENGVNHRGSHVTGYQDGEEAASFRAKDRAYLDPGTYEFRAQPNADNHLSVTETFTHGDHKEIVFEMVPTVRAYLEFVSSGSEISFRSNFELWQNGEKRYNVHRGNGAQVLPGTYDARLPLYLSPYVEKAVVITSEAGKRYRFTVPVGHLTIRYENSDGSPRDDTRAFLERKQEDGRWQSDRTQRSGERIPLVPGEYKLDGHGGTFETLFFEIEVGEELEMVLKDQG